MDTVRRFWKGDAGQIPELASRLSGSADIYQWTHRSACVSVNFVTEQVTGDIANS